MKVKFEVDENFEEEEIIIRCRKMTKECLQLQQLAESLQMEKLQLEFYDQGTEYYLPLEEILFFETNGGSVYAHTGLKQYQIKNKLYELEDILPRMFMRVAKSMIINIDCIYSLTKNITSSSIVEFYGTPKKAYVSRGYYKSLKNRLGERRRNSK